MFLRTLFSGKLHFKDTESSFVWKRLFLPLAIKIGLRGTPLRPFTPFINVLIYPSVHSSANSVEDASYIDEDDVIFIMETIFQMGEQIHYIIKYRSSANQLQIKRFFTGKTLLAFVMVTSVLVN